MLPTVLTEFSDLFEYLLQQDTPIYLVGGAVRDLILGHSSHDLDFVVLGNASGLARKTANHFNGAFYWLDTKRDTARVLLDTTQSKRFVLDFAEVREGSLNADLMDRDFTINAIVLDLETKKLIDPLNGTTDLRNKILRACSPRSFNNDPARLLRAVRFTLYHELKIDPQTRTWMKTAVPSLPRVSGERIRDEFFRILESGKASTAVRLLNRTGSLSHILLELSNNLKQDFSQRNNISVWEPVYQLLQQADWIYNLIDGKIKHTRENIKAAVFIQQINPFRKQLRCHLNNGINPNRSLRGLNLYITIFLALTLPIFGSDQNLFNKEEIRRMFQKCSKRLALSNNEIQHGLTILENIKTALALIQQNQFPTRKQIYNYFNLARETGIDLCLIALSIIIAQQELELRPENWERILKNCSTLLAAWMDHHSEYINPPSLITGNDLLNHFMIDEGPWIGHILEQVREAQAVGLIMNQEEALEFAKNLIDEGSGIDSL